MIATPDRLGSFRPDSPVVRSREQHFRGSLGRFATGVAIVTFESAPDAAEASVRRGITVNSFTSVSLDPPLVLVSFARATASHDELAGRPFTVNVLGAEQESLARHFAGRPSNEPEWVEGDRSPRLSRVLAWFDCMPWAEYDGGDHTLYIGEVANFDYRTGDALGFVSGRFTTIPESLLGQEDLL